MERIRVSVHIQRVYREIISSQIERLKNLLESELCAIAEDDNVLVK